MGRCTSGIADGLINGLIVGFVVGAAVGFARYQSVQLSPIMHHGFTWAKSGALLFGALGVLRHCI